MKTLKSIILLVALLSNLHSFANNGSDTKSIINANVQKELKSHLDIKIEHSERVEVVFTTDENGKVNLAIAKTENKELKQAIETKFMEMHFAQLKADIAYGITLNLTRI
ncbi:MAG: hypothetical protein K0S33_980 [Bacteroidetes bacterium]|jgi:hypothetical protein|nr:hypothetical protein [Bacteroidota bacterium]